MGAFVVTPNKIIDKLGVCTTDFYDLKGMEKLLKSKDVLSITKYEKSIVHVPYHMDLISVKHKVNGRERVSAIIGIFSNSIYRVCTKCTNYWVKSKSGT